MIAVWVQQMIASERVEALKLYQILGYENFLNSKKIWASFSKGSAHFQG